MMHGRIKYSDGFTFIELLTVMMIIAVISAIVFSRFMFGDTDLIAQTEVIKTHIRYAQSQAMTQAMNSVNSDVFWGIQCDGNTFWLFRNVVPDDPDDPDKRVRLPGEATDTIDLTEKGLSSMESFTLSFDDWGTPHTDAAATDGQELVSADSEAQITVTAGEDTKIITITPSTGFLP